MCNNKTNDEWGEAWKDIFAITDARLDNMDAGYEAISKELYNQKKIINELDKSILKHQLILAETIAKRAEFMVDQLIDIIGQYNAGFEMGGFDVVPNGNTAFGVDEGKELSRRYLEDLQKRSNTLITEWTAELEDEK